MLAVEQVYQGVDYGKKGVDFTIALPRFRLPGKVDALAKDGHRSGMYNPRTRIYAASAYTLSLDASSDSSLFGVDHVQFHADDYAQSVVTHDKAFLHFMLPPSPAVLTHVHELTYDASLGSSEYGSNTSGKKDSRD